MKYYTLTLTLLDDVVISQRAASMGGHQSLDYIPGATLLGACAARLYEQLSLADAFTVFHSGKIRFCNGYPLSVSGRRSRPMPCVLYYPKSGSYQIEQGERKQLDTTQVIHIDNRDPEIQYKQLRKGYITAEPELEILTPDTTLRMKTAINPDTARAATSQLFGYQALQAGQVFEAVLQADGEVSDLVEQAISIMQGELLIGRSRSAQYGKVECQISEVQTPEQPTQNHTEQLQLWLQSDMALQDEHGQALMHGKTANLPDFLNKGIDWENSHLRFRRYSPYNGKRRSYDMERQVIEKGSLLAFNFTGNLDPSQWAQLQSGIGLYRESGLGQVLINPDWLRPDSLKNIQLSAISSLDKPMPIPSKPDTPLAHWLDSKTSAYAKVSADKQYAEQLINALPGLYDRARAYAGIAEYLPIGPSASQWSLVAEAGKLHQKSKQALWKVVFDQEEGICKSKDDAWSTETINADSKVLSFSQWLQEELNKHDIHSHGYVISLLARAAAEQVKAHKGGLS